MKRQRISKASVAFACDGTLIANVHNFAGEEDPEELLRRAIELGGEVSVGVLLRGREAQDTRSRIDDAGHEGAGAAFVDRERRRRKRARKDASTKKKRR